MQALVVPDAKDNILSLSKIADQGYRFCGDKYSMEFCNPCTGHVFAAYRNVKQFYVMDLATTNHKKPSNCNFMQRVPLGLLSTLFSREQIQRALCKNFYCKIFLNKGESMLLDAINGLRLCRGRETS